MIQRIKNSDCQTKPQPTIPRQSPAQRAYTQSGPCGSGKCLPRQEVGPNQCALRRYCQQSFSIGSDKEYRCSTGHPVSIRTPPLAGGHLAPHGNLCQAENIDILKGKLRILEILALWRLLCDTIPAQIP
jgi:hypothetical protein